MEARSGSEDRREIISEGETRKAKCLVVGHYYFIIKICGNKKSDNISPKNYTKCTCAKRCIVYKNVKKVYFSWKFP